jgi:hypothetical protein
MSEGPLAGRASRRLTSLATLTLAWLFLSAHVGTNQVVLEGNAGGYPVRVFIDPPGVVPAQVPILVRVLDGQPSRVTVRAAQWNVGTKGAPPAEDATPVPGDPGVWAHSLWIMTASSYAVYVSVEGPAGNGQLLVPLQTSATRMLGMQQGMGAVLSVLGLLLVAGLLAIVGAAQRDATLAPGERPTALRVQKGRRAVVATAAMLAVVLLGGSRWWDAEERAYKRRMQKPIATTTGTFALPSPVRADGAVTALTLSITDSLWRTNRYPQLVPDHGKLMHLFLIDATRTDATLAHLHPLRTSADDFVTALPPLPPGRYLVFGDLLFQSGATRTIVDTLDIGRTPATITSLPLAPDSVPLLGADEGWRTTAPVPLGTAAPLAGGGTLALASDGELVAGRDLRLNVRVLDPDGRESPLEPYMGMTGHAMVLRADGGVFVHLHPMGTASMTAQAQLLRTERGDTGVLATVPSADSTGQADGAHAMHDMPGAPTVQSAPAFPFAFPAAGDYLVFVQVRRRGAIETAAFSLTVAPRPAR